MLRLLTIGATCVALGLAAGCGDDEDEGGASGGSAGTGAEAAPAETQASSDAGGEKITVTMKDFAFDPEEVQAKVGQEIEWVNEDSAPHNAVAQEGGDFETETFEQGGSDSVTVDAPGTIQYICTVHPQMTGTIEVTE